MKKLALLTSGGDAPGMNAAIRAVVRTALYNGLEIAGIRRGYQGMIEGDIFNMETTSVSNIMQRGGTVLKTARSKEFLTTEGREKAYRQLKQHHIDGLILIGGDGTFKGANVFFKEHSLPAVGIPGTIDNDIAGTDYTLGFDTAVNTAVEAIDKIRDTAEAHDRIFIVEVMGRDAGYIALNSGIACGAEDILVPEQTSDINAILERIGNDKRRKKLVNIIVVAEGDDFGGADALRMKIMEHLPELDVRSTILGHIQRGGSPSYFDRVQASRMGYAAVNAIISGKTQVMVGLENQEIIYTSFDHAIKQHAPLDMKMLEMAKILAS
ncbi:6-phosphofructokinase [Taibaiella helva]|uniref:6-phosphofructokinase n=1 Tax=Taibaiella helva TaxID=2301235 RepID=UPI000E57708F|nr:6-phosphofructokinase [Taibaiella helva]